MALEKPLSLDNPENQENIAPYEKPKYGALPDNPAGNPTQEFLKKNSPEASMQKAIDAIKAKPANLEDVKFAEKLIQAIPVSKWLEAGQQKLRDAFLDEDNVVDFHGHDGAKWKIGAGDLLSREKEFIRVDGELGKRSISNRGKVGYLGKSGEYLAIFGGEKLDENPEVTKEEKVSLENIKIHSIEDEMGAKKDFLGKVKNEEIGEKEAHDQLLQKLNKMGLKIDGLDPKGFEKLDKEKVRTFLLEMKPREVYEFRKAIDKGGKKYSTDNFRELMKITGLKNEKISVADTYNFIKETLQKQGSVFSAEEVKKIGFASEAQVFQKILRIESGFKPFAVSNTGALGIAQMTSQNYAKKGFNPFDWKKSIEHQIDHFRADYQRFGDIEKAIVAYNRGGGYVSKMSKLHGPNWHFKMKGDEYGQQGYAYLEKMEKLRGEDTVKMR
jgi:hypothetical protein